MPDPVGEAPLGTKYLVDSSGNYLTETDGDHLVASTDGSQSASASGMLGTNIEDISDYSSSNWATINVFKASRPFLSGQAGQFYDNRPLTLDSDGYPTSLLAGQKAQSIIFLNAGYPTGNYVMTWVGSGTFEIYSPIPGYSVVSTAANRIVFGVPNSTSDGVFIAITATTPGNHVRDIKIKHSSHEFNNEIWHPDFINSVNYYSTLRFMDLQRTNFSPISTWAQRAKLTSAHWSTEAGVPVEALVDLANKAGANPWFCMPHLATNDFVTQFATIVEANLSSELKPYVECSNEVWNFQFDQAQYAVQQAAANTARYLNDGAGWIHWHSARTREMHNLWSAVYGGTSRFVRVIGTQAAQSYLLMKACSFEGNGAHFDVAAIGPYFGIYMGWWGEADGGLAHITVNQTEDQIMTTIETTQMNQVIGWISSCLDVANDYDLGLVAYEGGQHLVAIGTSGNSTTDATLDAKLVGVQDNPRMGAFYTQYLNVWKSMVPDGLFCHFLNAGGWGHYGSWGARERLSDPIDASEPKALALYNFALENNGVESGPVTWSGAGRVSVNVSSTGIGTIALTGTQWNGSGRTSLSVTPFGNGQTFYAGVNWPGSGKVSTAIALDGFGVVMRAGAGTIRAKISLRGALLRQPQVASAVALSGKRVRLTFDAKMLPDSRLKNINNYKIVPVFAGGADVFIKAVILPIMSFPTFVDLDVSEMTDKSLYSAQINTGFNAPVDQFGLGINVSKNSATFLGAGNPPTVLYVAATGPNRVDVKFSKPMLDEEQIRNPDNYQWDAGLVTIAVLGVISDTVQIVTSNQSPGQLYNLTIGS